MNSEVVIMTTKGEAIALGEQSAQKPEQEGLEFDIHIKQLITYINMLALNKFQSDI